LVELLLAVANALALVSDRINPLLNQPIGDLGILREDSSQSAVTGGHAASLFAKKNARGEAGFPPRPVGIVA